MTKIILNTILACMILAVSAYVVLTISDLPTPASPLTTETPFVRSDHVSAHAHMGHRAKSYEDLRRDLYFDALGTILSITEISIEDINKPRLRQIGPSETTFHMPATLIDPQTRKALKEEMSKEAIFDFYWVITGADKYNRRLVTQ